MENIWYGTKPLTPQLVIIDKPGTNFFSKEADEKSTFYKGSFLNLVAKLYLRERVSKYKFKDKDNLKYDVWVYNDLEKSEICLTTKK